MGACHGRRAAAHTDPNQLAQRYPALLCQPVPLEPLTAASHKPIRLHQCSNEPPETKA